MLPLNFDGLFAASLTGANTAPFLQTLGTLDASGRATGTFVLPAFALGRDVDLHWAFAAWNPQSLAFTWTSNAAPLTIKP